MKLKYLVDPAAFERPAIDAALTDYVETNHSDYWDEHYKIGIMHNGVIYRALYCDFHEIISFHQWLVPQGYTDLVGNRGALKGYSSLFVHNSDLRK